MVCGCGSHGRIFDVGRQTDVDLRRFRLSRDGHQTPFTSHSERYECIGTLCNRQARADRVREHPTGPNPQHEVQTHAEG